MLYNTQELVPNQFAPKPGELTARAEEVSEEDSPVDILAPDVPMLNWPNKITKADFDGVGRAARLEVLEQVGSGVSPDHRDLGSRPAAAAGRLAVDAARQGALHLLRLRDASPAARTASPGAYRLMANLLALGKTELTQGTKHVRRAAASLTGASQVRGSYVALRLADRHRYIQGTWNAETRRRECSRAVPAVSAARSARSEPQTRR